MSNQVEFGNSRRLGIGPASSQHWLSSLAKLDEAILLWPQLSLHTTDIIFTRNEAQETYLWREVVGYPTAYTLKEKQLIQQDVTQACGHVVRAELALETPLNEVFSWASGIMARDFKGENEVIAQWNLRQRVDFTGRDHVAAWWQLELHCERSRTSIFAF